MMKLLSFIKERFPGLIQFTNFSIVGLINLVLSYILYIVFISFNLHYQVANQIAFWLTVLNGYILNKYWVFKIAKNKRESHQKLSIIKYFIIYGSNIILGVLILYFFVDIIGVNKYVVPFFSMPITVPLNYFLNKQWAFRKISNEAN